MYTNNGSIFNLLQEEFEDTKGASLLMFGFFPVLFWWHCGLEI
jgi:hypothetical protein